MKLLKNQHYNMCGPLQLFFLLIFHSLYYFYHLFLFYWYLLCVQLIPRVMINNKWYEKWRILSECVNDGWSELWEHSMWIENRMHISQFYLQLCSEIFSIKGNRTSCWLFYIIILYLYVCLVSSFLIETFIDIRYAVCLKKCKERNRKS